MPLPPGLFATNPNQMWAMAGPSDYDYVSDGLLWHYLTMDPVRRKQLLLCPTDTNRPQVTLEYAVPPQFNSAYQRNFSYNFNAFWLDDMGPARGDKCMKFSRIRGSDHKLLIVEPENPEYGIDNIVPIDLNGYPINSPNQCPPRHFGSSNQCFVDGHVELFGPPQLLYPQKQSSHYILFNTP